MHYISTTKKSQFLNYPQKRWELFSVRRKCFALCGVWRDAMDWRTKRKNRVRPPGRTLPKATDNNDMYRRKFPNGNFLFFSSCKMSLFCLPCGKLAFAQRSGAMKAPVGLLSDRTVLRKQDGGASPRQVTAGLPRCSSRQGWPGRMPVPDGQ